MISLYRQPLIAILCGALLWAITAQINHYLAVWHLNLFTGGLMITYAALRFRSRIIWRVAAPLGLLVDAASAVPFGMHAALFLVAGVAIHRARGRKPRTDLVFSVAIAVLANAALFLVIAIAFAIRGPVQAGVVFTLFINLLLSSAFVALVAPWFFAFQTRALELAGIDARAQLGQTSQD
jgi:rod shape-determining protein MreD